MPKITFKMIDGEIAKFTTDADELNARAHRINVLILKHLAPKFCGEDYQGSGDMQKVPAMVMAMPASWRRTEEIRWWETFTPCRVKYSQGKVVNWGFDRRYIALAKKVKDDPEGLEAARKEWWDVETAINLPFHMMADDNPEETEAELDNVGDILKLIQALGKRVERKVDNGEVDPADESTVRKTAERLANFKIQRVKEEPEGA